MTITLSLIVSGISSLGVINALRASKAYVHAPGKAHNDDCLSRTQSSIGEPYALVTKLFLYLAGGSKPRRVGQD